MSLLSDDADKLFRVLWERTGMNRSALRRLALLRSESRLSLDHWMYLFSRNAVRRLRAKKVLTHRNEVDFNYLQRYMSAGLLDELMNDKLPEVFREKFTFLGAL